jgi:hypothetical protein
LRSVTTRIHHQIDPQRRIEIVVFILLLIIGCAFRLASLDAAPPGLTHDEADHALDAAGVLEGNTPIYFTVGYGREPLFDYVTAAVMLIIGKTYLASRITAALFGITLMVLTYAWVRVATQNWRLALAVMGAMAVSFWAVSTSREALRSETLPVLFMAAALTMRRGMVIEDDEGPAKAQRPKVGVDRFSWFVVAGLFLGLTFYTYLAARLMWLVFPAFYIFLSITQHGVIRKAWPGLLIMLLIAGVVAAPLFQYLMTHPTAEVRIGQLSGPVDALLAGDPIPLRENIRAGLRMITFTGDSLWLYNIPGKPLLGPIFSIFFYLGLSIALASIFFPYHPVRRGLRTYDDAFRISSANAFMLLTLVIGIIPALITGTDASNTRVIGIQPAVYYMPALAIMWLSEWAERQVGEAGARAMWVAYGGLLLVTSAVTIYLYFGTWNNARDVRVAYHTTMVETLRYLDQHLEIGPDVAISTITPGRFHDPAIAATLLRRKDLQIHWFDGRSALILPASSESYYLFPQVAPLNPALAGYLDADRVDSLVLRSYDFNPEVQIFQRSTTPQEAPVRARLGQALSFLQSIITSTQIRPGESFQVLTFWRINDQVDSEVNLFTHALDEAGQVVGQEDALGVPSSAWIVGDVFIQVHTIHVPVDLVPGILRIEIGAYTLPDIIRLTITLPNGETAGDSVIIDTIEVVTP